VPHSTGINDTGDKFAASVNYTSGNLPPVLTTPAANFATSTASVVDFSGQQFWLQISTGINNTSKFATGVNDNGGK
jgi:hypothetical protein